jgi:hypothetical protein
VLALYCWSISLLGWVALNLTAMMSGHCPESVTNFITTPELSSSIRCPTTDGST